jgi:zinc and cadmium transporter
MTPILYPVAAIAIISIISLVGVLTLSLKKEVIKKGTFLLIALSAGALLADAFVHLIPEALEEAGSVPLVSFAILAGIFLFFILEKYLRWHHSHGEVEFSEEHAHVHPVGPLVITSDALHNIIDGIAIGVAFFVSPVVGVATTVAVALHEIPQEIADFGLLLHAGYSKMKALALNFASALTAFIGLGIAYGIGESAETIVPYLGAFAAGNFIYIALADIVPELHKEQTSFIKGVFQFVAFVVGVAVMFALLTLE